jgi:hypothetical protein
MPPAKVKSRSGRRERNGSSRQLGPFSLSLQPKCEGERLVYRLIATQIRPITVPRILAPSMTA